jgi:uncharacterized protein YkwD
MHPAARALIAMTVGGSILLTTPTAQASASCPGANEHPNPVNIGQVESSTICLMNTERRAHGLGPLRRHRLLRLAAVRHSRDMVTNHFYSHTDPDGTDFVARVRATGYLANTSFWRVGENLDWGIGANSTPSAIVRAWMNSPPHRHSVLSRGFGSVGVGVGLGTPPAAGQGGTYTADFGYRRQ